MHRTSETPRWSAAPPAARRIPLQKEARVSKRDLLAIIAGSVAITGIGIAFAGSGDARDEVLLRERASVTSGTSGLSPVESIWSSTAAQSGASGIATPAAQAASGLPLVARTEAEHIAQTQSFAGVMMPRLIAGKVAGFTIREGAMPPLFAHAGVQAGDVVVSINGRNLTSNVMLSGLSRELPGARRADIVVERAGKRETLGASLTG